MTEETPKKKTKTQEAIDNDILPRIPDVPGLKDPKSEVKLYKHMSLDQFIQFCTDKDNIDRVMENVSGLHITAKSEDIDIAVPTKVKLFCEENDLSLDQFVNMAFNFFVDLMVEGRDSLEFKLSTRVRNCPYIKREHKFKALMWIYHRFQRKQKFLWNIIKKEPKYE